ncbi:hypothetical protein [Mediterraneibacter agrestimuris]|uniref:hypothetical protein n=1 Tax=Mediterraneibacter agrestimuris TaxID=2941333 RepID=UPI00203CF8A7|nr:hypothetical protein [Mediterraneibacter agrestimuris]
MNVNNFFKNLSFVNDVNDIIALEMILITEVYIYADKDGRILIPLEYRSNVIYGEDVTTLAVSL